MKKGQEDRKDRLINPKSGVSGSSSQDIIRLARILYQHSHDYANKHDGNVSIYAIAGIPMLFSALRALLVELNSNMWMNIDGSEANLEYFADKTSDKKLLIEEYEITPALAEQLSLLYEVRNEIVHPAHTPTGILHNTPDSLLELRELGVLQSTGKPESDYIWISQLQSHRLFQWAFTIIEQVVVTILEKHNMDGHIKNGILNSWSLEKN